MISLRKRMIEDMQVQNLSVHTQNLRLIPNLDQSGIGEGGGRTLSILISRYSSPGS